MNKLSGKFIARGSDGRTYQVVEYQSFVDAGTKDGDDWIPGPKFCRLSDGTEINRLDERTWETVDGLVLKRLR